MFLNSLRTRSPRTRIALVLLAASCPGALAAEPDEEACKAEIVKVLAGMDALPAHEETSTTVHENRKSRDAAFEATSNKRSVVRRIAPDRYSFALWKQGQLRLESISIGERSWNREPGGAWELEQAPQQGSREALADDVAARVTEAAKLLVTNIKEPRCQGKADFRGTQALRYSYRLLMSQSELWVDAASRVPLEERSTIELDALNARSLTTRVFRYDEALRIDAPM